MINTDKDSVTDSSINTTWVTNDSNNIGSDAVWSITDILSYEQKDKNIMSSTQREIELENRLANQEIWVNMFIHDIKNTLGPIVGVVDMLWKENKEKNIDSTRLKILRLASDRAEEILASFEWYFKLLKEWEVTIGEINISHIITKSINHNEAIAKDKNIKISYSHCAYKALVNGVKLFSALNNLIYNSIKFTNSWWEIKITESQVWEHIEISIEDNGIGMSDAVKNNLFDIEKTRSRRWTNNEKWTWLGLINSKLWLEVFNGEISVDSTEGEGTTFTIKLPLV